MVERYNQPQLPSLVVGTPGVDKSAGEAAGEVAKLSQEATSGALQFAAQRGNQAQGLYEQAQREFGSSFNYSLNAINEMERANRYQQYAKEATRNLQNSLLASNAKLDQQTMV